MKAAEGREGVSAGVAVSVRGEPATISSPTYFGSLRDRDVTRLGMLGRGKREI